MRTIFACLFPTFLIVATNVTAPACAQEGSNEMVLSPKGVLNLNEINSTPSTVTRDAEALVKHQTDLSSSYFRTMGGLLVILGVLGGATLYLKRLKERQQSLHTVAKGLEIIERLTLAPRREILLVRTCEQIIVLANLPQDLKFLTALPAPQTSTKTPEDLFGDLIGAATAREEAASIQETTHQTERAPDPVQTAPAPSAPVRTSHRAATPLQTSNSFVEWPGF